MNTSDRHASLGGHAALRRGRLFQFAAKYWFGCSASLVGIVWLSQDVPSLRPWNPLYVIFTMVVILSEKVRPACPCIYTCHVVTFPMKLFLDRAVIL